MIVLTNPTSVVDEINIIHELFETGLAILQIRKTEISKESMKIFINSIDSKHHDKLVLSSHYTLADLFNIKGLHLKSQKRLDIQGTLEQSAISYYNSKGLSISTSVHSIAEFNALESYFDYAFLSPVFKSISKEEYYPKKDLFEALQSRTNFTTKAIALGGITFENIIQTLANGFDDVALLGAIWMNENPTKKYKLCQQIALSYSL